MVDFIKKWFCPLYSKVLKRPYLQCSGSPGDTSWSLGSVWAGVGTYIQCSPDTHTSSACSAARAGKCWTVLGYLRTYERKGGSHVEEMVRARKAWTRGGQSPRRYLGLGSWWLSYRRTPHYWSSAGETCGTDISVSPSPPCRPRWSWGIGHRHTDLSIMLSKCSDE